MRGSSSSRRLRFEQLEAKIPLAGMPLASEPFAPNARPGENSVQTSGDATVATHAVTLDTANTDSVPTSPGLASRAAAHFWRVEFDTEELLRFLEQHTFPSRSLDHPLPSVQVCRHADRMLVERDAAQIPSRPIENTAAGDADSCP